MKTFLQETAETLTSTQQNLKDTICIVPSERAGVYLKEAIKDCLQGQISFLPKIVSIENFIKEISGLESKDQVSLVFDLFKIYNQEFKGETPDNFERFIGWATIAIQDFNEIDRHLVDAEEIFNYLTDVQKIKDWNPGEDTATETIHNYMSFVKDLYLYYQKLSAMLLSEKAGYQGLIYREAYHQHKAYIEKNANKSFHFIGFNALNKAEEEIFKSFLEKEQNHIYWDADAYYFDEKHEAGSFLRKFFSEWECLNKEGRKNGIKDHFSKPKNIQVLGAPLNVTGVKSATSYIGKELDPKDTAFVLAEESILPVVLNSIPSNVQKVNITMGYSLSNIPLSGLFQSVFDLHLNKQKLGKSAFYYKDLLSFLRHPYTTKVTSNRSNKVVEYITTSNIVFVAPNELQNLFKKEGIESFVYNLMVDFDNVQSLLNAIIHFVTQLNTKLEGIELLYVEGYRKVFQEIINLNNQYQYINSIKVLYKIFKKLLPLETVDFKGEALEGMQLMGMLETRCLDFKNVILTSVNEGVLPSGKSERSFISFEVKKQFNMPTYLLKDAVFSYHFYRLIQRAENVYLFYNTKTDEFGGGEQSRFLTQLMIDKEAYVTHQHITTIHNKTEVNPKEIEKTPEVMEKLIAYFNKGASPSRIIDYVNDPLVFYEKMILKIRETDKVEEVVASNTLGTIVHDSLEDLYTPYLNKVLIEDDILKMEMKAIPMVSSKFLEHFKSGDVSTGMNRLINEVANQFVTNFLKLDKDEIIAGNEIVVRALEEECNISFVTPAGHTIQLGGKIDRVDEVNGVRRIVDYKTGKVESKDLKLADIALATTDAKYNKALQVMTYVLLYTEKYQLNLDSLELQTGIYSFKNLKSGFLAMNFSDSKWDKDYRVTTENREAFKESLFVLIDEILDNKRTFVENLDYKYKREV